MVAPSLLSTGEPPLLQLSGIVKRFPQKPDICQRDSMDKLEYISDVYGPFLI
jgi:hypothetical protein